MSAPITPIGKSTVIASLKQRSQYVTSFGSNKREQIMSRYLDSGALLRGRELAPVSAIRESGIALVVVLVAILLMAIAAVGLIRMVDTGSLIVGNLAFKQGTTSAADRSTEAAITWLQTNNAGALLYNNNTANGYYATSLSELDISGKSSSTARALIDWDGDGCAYATSGSYATCLTPSAENANNGYTTQYLIARMCKTSGDPNATGNGCSKPVSSSSNASPKKGELKYGEDKRFETPPGPYFRIVARSKGPRNTVSFTETYVHF
jgi:Tfp pilus assembly protein PilX